MRIAAPITLVLAFLALAIFHKRTPAPATAWSAATPATSVYQRVCQACHGTAGEGNSELKTPSIAGQPAWHLERQLEQFQKGHRGTEPRDHLGQQMRAIVLTLSQTEIDEAVRSVAGFASHPTTATLQADPLRGREIYAEQCMECHRYNGAGEKTFGSSPLTTFQDWYLAAQAEKFRTGIRGNHPADEKGRQMRHLLSYLSETDIRDVSAYIATLAARYPP